MPISHTFLRKQPSFILFGALWVLFVILLSTGCTSKVERSGHYIQQDTLYIDRASYSNALEGFWLGTSIGNWTGLVTEMDKIGDIGEIKTGAFYTREDWGKPDEPNIGTRVSLVRYRRPSILYSDLLDNTGEPMTIPILSTCINI